MSDTTITPEERARWLSEAQPKNIDYYEPIDFELDKRIRKLIGALEQAEARVKSRNNHIHRLLGEALENERNLDGMKSRWQTAEAEVARLTKERDWLAEKVADLEDNSWTGNNSQVGKFAEPEYWLKEAARRAVAAGEG